MTLSHCFHPLPEDSHGGCDCRDRPPRAACQAILFESVKSHLTQRGNDGPDAPRVFHNSRTLSEHGVITMPNLKNLNLITKERFTLIGLPLNIVGAEAPSPSSPDRQDAPSAWGRQGPH
jgi:hypothetical protein